MASIKRRTTAKGEIRYDVRVRVVARVVTKTFRRRQDADRWARAIEADVIRVSAIDPRAGNESLSDYAGRWLTTRRVCGRPLAPRTMELYRDLLDRHVLPGFGSVSLAHLRPEAVRAWYAGVAERVSPLQAAKAYRLLRAMLRTAVDDRLLAENPCRIPGAGNERAAERPFIAPEVLLRFADAIDERYRALVLVAAFGGLRLGELLALRRRHFDAASRTVLVEDQAIQLRNGARVVTQPKTAAGRRRVHLPQIAADSLVEHLERFTAAETDAVVFTGPNGGPLRRATLYSAWRRTRATSGIVGLTIHDLRHSGATLAAWTGASTKELMARLGHASPQAALRYQHAASTRDRAIAEQLDAVVDRAQRSAADDTEHPGPRDGRAMERPAQRPRNRRAASDLGLGRERVTGIEPAFSAWEADVLPLNYTRRTVLDATKAAIRRAVRVLCSFGRECERSRFDPEMGIVQQRCEVAVGRIDAHASNTARRGSAVLSRRGRKVSRVQRATASGRGPSAT